MRKLKKAKVYKYELAVEGSGISGTKITSITEALALANYLLKQGKGVNINPI